MWYVDGDGDTASFGSSPPISLLFLRHGDMTGGSVASARKLQPPTSPPLLRSMCTDVYRYQ
jgi:hypothetical protein